MHAVRLTLRLLALVVVLILSACGSASISEELELRAPSAIKPATPTVPRIRTYMKNPVRLAMPAIGINAFVESVGTQSNADLATPTQNPWEDVGWYNLGPHPGERGSAVIDGHLDRPGGYPAVFWRLGDMKVGDDVQVTNNGGKILHFRVTHIEYYTPEQAPL